MNGLKEMIANGEVPVISIGYSLRRMMSVGVRNPIFWSVLCWVLLGSILLHPAVLIYAALHLCITGTFTLFFCRGLYQIH